MSDKAFDLVVEMVRTNKVDVEKRLDAIETKIDKLLQFKWQIIGGSVVLSAIITVAMQFGSFILKH